MVSVGSAMQRQLRRLGSVRNELLRHQLYKLEEITTMENDGVDFTVDIPDTFLFRFAALVLTPTVQEATADGGEQHPDEDIDLVIHPALSPHKPKSKPGPKTKPTADLSRKFPSPATHPTRQKRAFTTAYLAPGVLGERTRTHGVLGVLGAHCWLLTLGVLGVLGVLGARTLAPSILGVLGVPAHGWQIVAPVMIYFRKQ